MRIVSVELVILPLNSVATDDRMPMWNRHRKLPLCSWRALMGFLVVVALVVAPFHSLAGVPEALPYAGSKQKYRAYSRAKSREVFLMCLNFTKNWIWAYGFLRDGQIFWPKIAPCVFQWRQKKNHRPSSTSTMQMHGSCCLQPSVGIFDSLRQHDNHIDIDN